MLCFAELCIFYQCYIFLHGSFIKKQTIFLLFINFFNGRSAPQPIRNSYNDHNTLSDHHHISLLNQDYCLCKHLHQMTHKPLFLLSYHLSENGSEAGLHHSHMLYSDPDYYPNNTVHRIQKKCVPVYPVPYFGCRDRCPLHEDVPDALRNGNDRSQDRLHFSGLCGLR